jgi:hypothetical protein
MISRIESLPNEILLYIFSYLKWFDMLISFWSLNIRFDSLLCTALSINNHLLNSGLLITHGLSYKKCHSKLFPLIFNSSSLSSAIQRIHLDGRNAIACDLSYKSLFNKRRLRHLPNLKSFVFTQFDPVKPAVESLLYLIEFQLDELTLTFDNQIFQRSFHVFYVESYSKMRRDIGNELFLD